MNLVITILLLCTTPDYEEHQIIKKKWCILNVYWVFFEKLYNLMKICNSPNWDPSGIRY